MRLPVILGRCVALLTLLAPALACARVGEVLFVYGSAWSQSVASVQIELRKGATVEEGDRVTTGSNGRVQIRMDDGALVILRPSSELVIEQYRYSSAAQTGSAAAQTPHSVMSLVRGGLRAITGTLGKANPEAYEMQTAVATIGIRGTDYSALYCAEDCGDIAPGLYVGVAEGFVFVRNAAGLLDLAPGEHAFVRDAQTAPVPSQAAGRALALANDTSDATATADANDPPASPASAEAAHALLDDGAPAVEPPSTPETAVVAEDDSGESVDLVSGGLGGVALAYAGGAQPGFSAVTATGASGALRSGHGDVIAFSGDTPAGAGRMEHTGGDTLDAGRDGKQANGTGLQWGRWSGGSMTTTVAGVTQTHALDGESVHWIIAGTGERPELPTTGHADFELIGNTNPTDDAGHVGALGSASLSADFTARTVDAELSLSFSQLAQVWKASARDVPLNASLATFGGAFSEVTVSSGGVLREGSGSLSGFFTGHGHTLTGAGLSYGLTDGVANISGTAAFQQIETGP